VDRLRFWFPDLRALYVIVPLSVYSVGEPGLVPLTLALFVAWLILFRRWWKRAEAPRLRTEPALLVLAVVVGFGSLMFAATPSLAFRASRGSMQAEAEAILAGESAPRQGVQFVGFVPVRSIRPSPCEDGVVLFVTMDAAFIKEGYAFSPTPLPLGEPTCTYRTLGGDWYWATLNYG
jgi:hypothetical protein